MGRYIGRKLLSLPLVILAVSFLVFVVLRLLPGDPARLMAGTQATQAAVEAMRHKLGLDQSILTQYALFLGDALKGDLGASIRSKAPVLEEIVHRFPATLQLTAASLGLAIVVGVTSGALAAVFQYSWFDNLVMFVTILGASVANFWLALMLMSLFAVNLGWLPLMGAGSWRHLILPALSLGLFPTAMFARMTRSSMLEVIQQDYVLTALAKGLGRFKVFGKHALRNAVVPVITLMGLQFGVMLGGAVVTETVFSWPGIGRLLVDAVRYRDYPLIQGTVLFTVVCVVVANSLADILIAYANPRIRYE